MPRLKRPTAVEIVTAIVKDSLLDALYNHNTYRVGTKFNHSLIRDRACDIAIEIDKKTRLQRRRGLGIRRQYIKTAVKEIKRKAEWTRVTKIRQPSGSKRANATDSDELFKSLEKLKRSITATE
jgi:hypothetical protein